MSKESTDRYQDTIINSNEKVEYSELIPCYVINILTGKRIQFKLIPDDLSESLSASFEPQSIRGRSAPFLSYENTGSRTVSFSVTLHEEYCDGGILDTVNKLKALVYPTYVGSIVAAPKCYVRFGNMIGMKAIIESVGVSWEKPILRDANGKSFFAKAEVSLDFTELIDYTVPNAFDIEKSGGFREY